MIFGSGQVINLLSPRASRHRQRQCRCALRARHFGSGYGRNRRGRPRCLGSDHDACGWSRDFLAFVLVSIPHHVIRFRGLSSSTSFRNRQLSLWFFYYSSGCPFCSLEELVFFVKGIITHLLATTTISGTLSPYDLAFTNGLDREIFRGVVKIDCWRLIDKIRSMTDYISI